MLELSARYFAVTRGRATARYQQFAFLVNLNGTQEIADGKAN
jgi:hypothetical protein